MIVGIGTDLVEIVRFDALLARHGARAGQRILAPEERDEWARAALPARFLAKRFAAKEAFAKAVGTGVRAPVLLTAIRIGHDALGKPELAFEPVLAAWLTARGIRRTHLSISDERSLCSAFVVLEG
ncbi:MULTISPECIES: holo-ACP synthase [Microvirgula]|uniref:Holo-[acyl-carrier-protein] synthase n=1 Tax=Microvirgula aerodenitrificans TaxID=57480 RepID=A0A2S0PDK5_9NEIS|nr:MULTISPECIES: holo-ACP synthase [Microvirgula]AVY95468.1 holo-ACP synthase [Microvirgula aerodenitrificans]RAS14403.1 holo-[acyl-carrier protein] synthase [Microvirgula sp. AG722]